MRRRGVREDAGNAGGSTAPLSPRAQAFRCVRFRLGPPALSKPLREPSDLSQSVFYSRESERWGRGQLFHLYMHAHAPWRVGSTRAVRSHVAYRLHTHTLPFPYFAQSTAVKDGKLVCSWCVRMPVHAPRNAAKLLTFPLDPEMPP